jgi:hypothetical protein
MEVTVDIRSPRIGSQQAVPISKHEPWESKVDCRSRLQCCSLEDDRG